MLTHLSIRNFKSVGEPGLQMHLRPLTILVGPNGAGKSTIWEALALISQSLGGNLERAGRFVQYPAMTDVVFRHDAERWISVSFTVQEESSGYQVQYQPSSNQLKQSFTKHGTPISEFDWLGDRRTGFACYLKTPNKEAPIKGRGSAQTILDLSLFNRDNWPDLDDVKVLEETMGIADQMRQKLTSGYLVLSTLRGDIPGDAQGGPEQGPWLGIKGEGLLQTLALIYGSRRYDSIRQNILRFSEKFGLSKLNAGVRPNSRIGADYLEPTLKVPINLSLGSYGTRQIITVITQLFWAAPNSTVVIEEPEISLHPEYQLELLDLFGAAIAEQKQIVVTTHSNFLLLGIRRAVTNQWLKSEDIAIYEVSKREKGTALAKVEITNDGYLKRGASSFLRVEKRLMDEWAASLPKG